MCRIFEEYMQYSRFYKGTAQLPAQCPLLWSSTPQPIWPTLISFTCNMDGAFDIHIDWVNWMLLWLWTLSWRMSDQYSCIPSNLLPAQALLVPMVPLATSSLSRSKQCFIAPKCSSSSRDVHLSSMSLHFHFCQIFSIWIKNFRGIHSCCDPEQCFR